MYELVWLNFPNWLTVRIGWIFLHWLSVQIGSALPIIWVYELVWLNIHKWLSVQISWLFQPGWVYELVELVFIEVAIRSKMGWSSDVGLFKNVPPFQLVRLLITKQLGIANGQPDLLTYFRDPITQNSIWQWNHRLDDVIPVHDDALLCHICGNTPLYDKTALQQTFAHATTYTLSTHFSFRVNNRRRLYSSI